MTLRAPQRVAPPAIVRPSVRPSALVPDVADYLEHLRAVRRLDPKTVALYGRQLAQAVDHLEARGIQRWSEVRTKYTTGLSDAVLRLVERLLDYQVDMHRLPVSPVVRTPPPVRPHDGSSSANVRPLQPLTREEMTRLLDHLEARADRWRRRDGRLARRYHEPFTWRRCSPELAVALRDKALIEFGYASGARATEIVELQLAGLDLENREARIIGKGDRERIVYFGAPAEHALREWLARGRLRLAGKGSRSPFVFVGDSGGHVSQQTLRALVTESAAAVGIARHVRTHELRASFACHLLEGGAPVDLIGALLGHACLAVTVRYLRVGEPWTTQQAELHPRA